MRAGQVCTSPPARSRTTPHPSIGLREVWPEWSGEATTLLHLCHLHTAGDQYRQPETQKWLRMGSQWTGLWRGEQEEGRHGSSSWRSHKTPPRHRDLPTEPQVCKSVPSFRALSKGRGEGAHLGVQDRAEFQSHCIITESLRRERETHSSGTMSWRAAGLSCPWKSIGSQDLQGQEAWELILALLLTNVWPRKSTHLPSVSWWSEAQRFGAQFCQAFPLSEYGSNPT